MSEDLNNIIAFARYKLAQAQTAVDSLESNILSQNRVAAKPRPAGYLPSPAYMLDIHFLPDGNAAIIIDNRPRFIASRKNAILLQILASGAIDPNSGYTGYISADEVLAQLHAEEPEYRITRATLCTRIARLRKLLEAHHIIGRTVEYNRTLRAYRFLLRPS